MSGTKSEGSAVSIIAATDIHYLSADLYDEGEAFRKLMSTGDGKYTEGSALIMRELTETVKREKPDAVFLCGDLTFNGELYSLQEIAGYLAEMEEAGSRVFVTAGNHDIEYPMAAMFRAGKAIRTDSISPKDFRRIMAPYGFDEAFAEDEASLSYAAEVREDLWLLALDANTPEEPGSLRSETLAFAEGILKEAEEKNIRVITMTHQNVLKQNDLMYQGFVIGNHEATAALLQKYHVLLNLSGHSHLQHTAVSGGLTDICTESLSVWPLTYGSLQADPAAGTFTYENRSLNILDQESRARFDETVLRMIEPVLDGIDLPEEEKEEMRQLACEVNAMYFAGRLQDRDKYLNSKAWQNWQTEAGDSFWHVYLKQILEE